MGIYIQEVQLSASSYTNTGVGGRSLDLNRPKQRLAMANNNKVLAAIVCICLVSGSQAFFLPMMMMGGNNDAMPGFLCMINPQMCPMAMFSGSDSARTIGFMNMMRQKGGASQMQKMAPLMAFSGSDSLRSMGLMSMMGGFGGQQQQPQQQQQQASSGNAGSA